MSHRNRSWSAGKRALLWGGLLCSVLIVVFCPRLATAESSIKGSVINTPARVENSANIAAGTENSSRQFSIVLKNARVGGTIANSGQAKSAVNLAVGKRNLASQSSISVKNGTVTGSVSNSSKGKNLINAAVGSRNQANQSAIVTTSSRISGKLVNSPVADSTINMAVGKANMADQGSIRGEHSSIRGTVLNSSKGKNSVNLAVGKANSSSQGAVVIQGGKVQGIVVNRAADEEAVNAAIGYGNMAVQSSVVVDGGQPVNWAAGDGGQSTGAGPEHLARDLSGRASPRKLTAPGQRTAVRQVPGQVVFLVDNDKTGRASLDRVARKYRLEVGAKKVLKSLNRLMVVSSTGGNVREVSEALKNESGIYASQPNYIFETMGVAAGSGDAGNRQSAGHGKQGGTGGKGPKKKPRDPLSPMQNLVSLLDLPKIHASLKGQNVRVAVVDTGVELEHQDLQGRIESYRNFVDGSSYRGEIHGTAVAGIIGAGRNAFGIVGIAPEATLLALRACRQLTATSARGECFSSSLAQALDVAIEEGVDLVNLSLGALVEDSLLGLLIADGDRRGIIFTAPVGNDPSATQLPFPASDPRVVSVAGIDENGRPLPNHDLATLADAVAPATSLFVTIPGNRYNFIDGSSLASAAIAGILALGSPGKTVSAPHRPVCLPKFSRPMPWPQQVFACLGL